MMERTLLDCQTCSLNKENNLTNACDRCKTINTALIRYSEANIPVRYWNLSVAPEDFTGDKILLNKYQEVVKDIKDSYRKGICLCFAGSNGLGKTLISASILKRAVEKGYTALYTTLSDIVNVLVSASSEEKNLARKELMQVDFLVIDEFDPRYMGSDNAADLFGRVLEDVLRNRTQNTLPLFLCTNSPSVLESFSGPIKMSIGSLMNYVTTVSVLGKDQRKQGK